MRKFFRITVTFIFIVYLIILTKEILFKFPLSFLHHDSVLYRDLWHSSNIVPFKTIYFYLFLADINFDIRVRNLAGNVVGFMPLGFLLPIMFARFSTLRSVFLASFSLSLTYEVLQLLLKLGSFDIDDLILNSLGGLLGFLCFKLAAFFFFKRGTPRTFTH
ncbi:hypothetical protein A8F94_15915 [Bacillus sp. FJAT-27225]|uniref:VanZ family protein n=1 Tax=Bacillus sp. FJAT-27225 TaxID=1743144 RepID=UPI00080C2CE6|nr:VanZ family protein [Bacillus sp. FJAT-27225]OCA84541.1 hypothetical protein A8F94_15915 [Bacillus sp. FJAT-27225]